jgi:surfactin synthase thioesterase subunit|tara:strand:- start:9177 stop:9932 length:756 start_codon:yes stop_codon:yes gene_type:complete
MAGSWIEKLRGDVAAVRRLFIFPFAGGASVFYRPWAPLFPADLEVNFVMLPGRESRFGEPAFTSMAALIEELLPALEAQLDDRPFAFFGHSMGAAIAYELALRLQENGKLPQALFVSGRRPPGAPRQTPAIYHLPDAQFLDALRKLGGTPEEVLQNQDLLELFLPLLRADFQVSDTHAPTGQGTLRCPLEVFGGSRDPEASLECLAGWRARGADDVEITAFEGNHFFLSEHRQAIIERIAARLRQGQLSTA